MKITRFHEGALQVRRVTLTARRKPSVTVFPMVHVAEPAFFEEVSAEASAHDVVLYEGVKAAAGRAANVAYRIAAAGRSPLASQAIAMKAMVRDEAEPAGAVWLNSDVPRARFKVLWSKVPWWQRMVFYAVMPFVGLALRFRKVRDFLAQSLGEMPDTDDDSDYGPFGAEFKHAVMDARDAHLLDQVLNQIEAGTVETIAVVWGAKHMPPLVKALVYEHGYKTDAEEWQTVFVTENAAEAQDDENSVRA